MFVPPADRGGGPFFTGFAPATAERLRNTIRPEPVAPLTTPLVTTAERWGSVPKTYVTTTADHAVGPALQTQMYERAGIDGIVIFDGAHPVALVHHERLRELPERDA